MNGHRRNVTHSSHDFARQWHEQLLERDPHADYLKRMAYVEFRNRLPELLLMRVDKVSMAASVEARVPFLDHRIVEYSMTIPARWKIKNGESKYILKKAVEGIVPRNIIYRKKQGFAAPVSEWLRNEWSTFTAEKLLNSTFVKNQYFSKDFIKATLEDHRSGRNDAGQNIWNLLNLVLWHEYWIEGRSLDG